MNNNDVNDRKQKLNDIIKKITESQLLKMREADNDAGNRQDRKFVMTPQEQDNDMNKAIPIKLLNEELSHFGAAVGSFNPEVAGTSEGMPAALKKPVNPGVTL